MLLTAVLLAAAVQVAPAIPATPGAEPPARIEDGRVIQPMKPGCALGKVTPADDKGENSAHPLSKEPRSGLRYAVMRMVDGCPVDSPMRVSRKR